MGNRQRAMDNSKEAASKRAIVELVQFAITDKTSRNRVLTIAKLTNDEASMIKLKSGLDVSGYTRVIDKSGINHAFNQHGNIKIETH